MSEAAARLGERARTLEEVEQMLLVHALVQCAHGWACSDRACRARAEAAWMVRDLYRAAETGE